MKIEAKRNLNIRQGPDLSSARVGVLLAGNQVEVEGATTGQNIQGNSLWYVDRNRNYYWGGGVQPVGTIDTILQESQPASPAPARFPWFDMLRINEIWDTYGERGQGATIAVLDTGYNALVPEIVNAIGGSKIVITPEAYPGIPLVEEDQSNIGHGSRCLSLAGARTNGRFSLGVAPESRLLSAKISINREIRDFDFILQGIQWAIGAGADVISISYAAELSDADKSRWEAKYLDIIKDKNVLIFAAAGNAGSTQMPGERYPASFNQCISVGAVDLSGNWSPITILSNKTLLHAPGIDVESIGKSPTPDVQSGTSYATPIIAGIAGLAVAYLKRTKGNWNAIDLHQKLQASATVIGNQPTKKLINGIELFKQIAI
jgi:major intracellular serine protease